VLKAEANDGMIGLPHLETEWLKIARARGAGRRIVAVENQHLRGSSALFRPLRISPLPDSSQLRSRFASPVNARSPPARHGD
jgi:hypothetical protein